MSGQDPCSKIRFKMPLPLGSRIELCGNVTTLLHMGTQPPRVVAGNLGYEPVRLNQGYYVLLLRSHLKPEDFEFHGNTMRSGGRYGLPGANSQIDQARPTVHDKLLKARGDAGYRELQSTMLKKATYRGRMRLAKVIPVMRHNEDMKPNQQYPMGGGSLQWNLIRPCAFFVAAFIDSRQIAHTADFEVSVSESTPYQQLMDNRSRLRQYLEGV